MNKIIMFVLAVGLIYAKLSAQVPVTIYTPNGSVVPEAYLTPELTQTEIDYFDDLMAEDYPAATIIELGAISGTYNCHDYAWYVSEGGENVWIGYGFTAEDIFWTDGSYTEITTWAENEKVSYLPDWQDNHSAVTTASLDYLISKWGKGPLVGPHHYSYCPFWHSGTTFKYYERTNNPATSPTFSPLTKENNLIITPDLKFKNGVDNVNIQ